MYIPARAIITAQTPEEAERLLNFLTANGYKWIEESTKWPTYSRDTCYNLELDKHVMFCDRGFYETEVDRRYSGEPDTYGEYSFIPDDPTLIFISTNDFITRCMAEDDADSNIDISDLI